MRNHCGARLGVAVLATLIAACSPAADDASTDGSQAVPTPTPEPIAIEESPSPSPEPSPTPSPSPTGSLPPRLPDDYSLDLEPVAEGLAHPVFVTSPPDDDRLFVLERKGRIRIIEDGEVLDQPFLDIDEEVKSGNEQGLLGLAFHPDYANNGRLFVYYTAEPDGESRLEEYTVNADGSRARPASARRILTQPQPHRWHNAGMIAFAPDGMLMMAFGDGGGQEAPEEHGQDPTTLLGTLVRIDVDGTDADREYAIPPDNPFTGGRKGAPEVWAYGLRNPWRFAVDPFTDLLYIADVGQYAREELNVVEYGEPGLNFGWSQLEGSTCVGGDEGACDSGEFVEPVLEEPRDDGGCAIIGGSPYWGAELPELHGTYFYGDYCAGWIRSLRMRDGEVKEERDWSDQLPTIPEMSSFGADASGELYVVSLEGTIHRLTAGE